MAGTLELGTFLVFVIVPFLALFAMKALRGWSWGGMVLAGLLGLVGFIMISFMAILMFFETDIVVTKQIAAATEQQITRNATGAILTNTTITTPATSEATAIIDSQHETFGMIFFGLAFIMAVVSLKVIFVP